MTERVSGDTEKAYSIWLNSGLLNHRDYVLRVMESQFACFKNKYDVT